VSPEDTKIVTLARGARLRAYAPHGGLAEGAAVRDVDGRTYAAATIENSDPGLTLSAVRAAVGAAVSSGARAFEAAAVVTDGLVSDADLAVLREFGVGTPLLVVDSEGVLREIRSV
jgi:cytidine deaminase